MSAVRPAEQHSQHFAKAHRLLNASDYSRVFDGAEAKASNQYVLLLAKTSTQPRHRLGLVVAKKNVRLAVQRNRVKRIAREVFRTQDATPPYMDVVLLARRGIDQLDNAELSSILREQWRKLAKRISQAAGDRRQQR